MPFTAPVLSIGEGLTQGILTGTDTLNKAISYVGEQYVNAKAAEGTAQYLASTGAMSKDELNEFMGKSVGAKQQILGMKMAQYMAGTQLNNQKALQNNQSANTITQQANEGQVQIGVNKANTENQIDAYKKYGYLPGRSPDQMPAAPAQPSQPSASGAQFVAPSGGAGGRALNIGGVQHPIRVNPLTGKQEIQNPQSGAWLPLG